MTEKKQRRPLNINFQTTAQVVENMNLVNTYVPRKQMRPENPQAIEIIKKNIMY